MATGSQASSFLQQGSSWWALADELEGTVVVHSDDNRNRHAVELSSLVVELLNELTEVHTETTQRGTDRRSRSGLTAGDLKLRLTYLFPCHFAVSRAAVCLDGVPQPNAM